jgi:hypothetical protein
MLAEPLILSLALINCFFISCSGDKKPIREDQKNNNIVLIFKDVPTNWKVYRKAGGYTPGLCEITYIDDNFIPLRIIPDSEHEYDTVCIKTKRMFVEFRHSFKVR